MESGPHNLNDLDYIQSPPLLDRIIAQTLVLGFDMASEPRTGALLRTLAASKPSGRFLELGTGTGIATNWLLDGMDAHSTLTSVDVDARVQEVARQFLGDDDRLTLVHEDGLQFLRHEKSDSYDFVFADAMPGKYDGLQEALRVVRPGGFYVIDDMLPQKNWPDSHAPKIPTLIDKLASDKSLRIVPLTWASGIVVAVKRGNS